MTVATPMRRGGTDAAPTSGKPAWTADHVTGVAVVNWIREGFALPPAE
jgi:hypothetical protein